MQRMHNYPIARRLHLPLATIFVPVPVLHFLDDDESSLPSHSGRADT